MPGTHAPPESLLELVVAPELPLDSEPESEPSTGVLPPQAGRAEIRNTQKEVQERPVMRGLYQSAALDRATQRAPCSDPGSGAAGGLLARSSAQNTWVTMSSAPIAATSTFSSSQNRISQALVTSEMSTMRGRLMHCQPSLKLARPSSIRLASN